MATAIIRVRHQHNYVAKEARREINTKPGLTVPDQTMSIKEIMERFARGIPMDNVAKIPIYDGEENQLPDIRTLDLSEVQQLTEEARALGTKFRERREAQERDQADAAAKELAELKAAANELKELKAQSTNNP